MKKRIVAVLIVLAAVLIASVYIANEYLIQARQEQFVFPVDASSGFQSEAKTSSFETSSQDDDTLTSLIDLRSDETLIGVVSQDFNGDGYDDQINAVKTASSPYISLIVGIYNPDNFAYEREAVIATQIIQSSSFSFTGMDLTGDHRTALVYQGFKENGDSVLQAFFLLQRAGAIIVKMIADLSGDGSIFIQQVDRYDEYDRSRANGASYPIWVYKSDSAGNGTDQLQICYDWSVSEGCYKETKRLRVAGIKIAQKELERIQDGTVETFAGFLNGLWCKKSPDGDYYVFFDYDGREIIFFRQEEEIYEWTRSNLRRNGIYLFTVNQEIENLQRRIDVSLRNVDEINLRIQDDVRMLITETNLWDGSYKKLLPGSRAEKEGGSSGTDFVRILEQEKGWKMADDTSVVFDGGFYTATGDIINDSGLYTKVTVLGADYIQFRSNTENPLFKGMYMISFLSDDSTGALVFKPYKVLPDGTHPSGEKTVLLTR
ncbi:MAG: pallilysin-related adhesin [Treponema sp.]|nr:pallilysin-related adhesin [Treponema sp.]